MDKHEAKEMHKEFGNIAKVLKGLSETSMNLINKAMPMDVQNGLSPEMKEVFDKSRNAYNLKNSKGGKVDIKTKHKELIDLQLQIHNITKNHGG